MDTMFETLVCLTMNAVNLHVGGLVKGERK
jgi:hypothetical protein